MNERTKLLKKAVLTSVGAGANVDRVKKALNEVMDDLVKVGRELFDDLEVKGKDKTESVQTFLKNLQIEATARAEDIQGQVSSKVQSSVKKAAIDLGFITREEYTKLANRINSLEKNLGKAGHNDESKETRTRKSRTSN